MKHIAIVGAGVSGLFSAYLLSMNTHLNIEIFEAGDSYESRNLLDSKDQIMGVGGAGTLSGGKLCHPPASSGVWNKTGLAYGEFENFYNTYISQLIFQNNKSKKSHYIYDDFFEHKSYSTTLLLRDDMHNFIENLLAQIKMGGVMVHTKTQVNSISKFNNKYRLNFSSKKNETLTKTYDYLIFATGRSSAYDLEKILTSYTPIIHQPPDLGIRITTDNKDNTIFNRTGEDIKLKAGVRDVSVRTFCVCAGGDVTQVAVDEALYFDGHFGNTLTNKVNFGLLARNPKLTGNLYAKHYCQELNYLVNSDISLRDFVTCHKKFLGANSIFSETLESIAEFVSRMIKYGLIKSNIDEYQTFLPSIDRLNPVICTNRFFETASHNLYVIGDAAGISRGYIQSIWSAYYASLSIMQKCNVDLEVRKLA